MPKYRLVFSVKDENTEELYGYEIRDIVAKGKQCAIRVAQTQLEKDCPKFERYYLNLIEEE